ncbi:cystatin-POGU1 [Salminus brasiliensis]|uniref:cystatin-POGU1 n=1 Tax=Salminus brasiliensis TaxID=930266 RepID=UPI003B8384A1
MTYTRILLAAVVMASVWSGSSLNVEEVANFAIDSHNRMSNSAFAYKVVKVMSERAELYPPTWVKFSLEVRVAETNCRNDGKAKLEDCNLKTNAQTMICSFVVLAVPGENTVPSHLLSGRCA